MKAKLSIGPILFHWPAEQMRDFYFRIADEAPVDVVYIGEVICSKRAPFFEKNYEEVADRLQRSGKKVIFSTLAEVMTKRERKMTESMSNLDEFSVEANDAAALYYLRGKPHYVGLFQNTYNEEALAYMVQNGATHFTLPPELPAQSLTVLSDKARELGVSLEAQVYGRLPLALSARCYHARAHGRVKDNCQFICGEDPDGMELKTLDDNPFLVVNGIQTLSYRCLNLVQEIEEMKNMGIGTFRLSPHNHDMVGVSHIFRSVLDYKLTPEDATIQLEKIGMNIPFANGFYHSNAGHKWVEVKRD